MTEGSAIFDHVEFRINAYDDGEFTMNITEGNELTRIQTKEIGLIFREIGNTLLKRAWRRPVVSETHA